MTDQSHDTDARVPGSGSGFQSDPGTDPFFALEGCSVVFGGLVAVNEVAFRVNQGDMVGLIGPNGAGKTTIFNLATGVYTPTKGRILFQGREIAGPGRTRGRKRIARAGICRTFQNIRLFQRLSVLDNVLIGSNYHMRQTLAASMLRTAMYYRTEREARSEAAELLSVLKLDLHIQTAAGSLPYGAQRRLEIARALATRPKLLLLDEPAAGMNRNESHDLMETIRQIRSTFGVTILLIEHDMKVVMGLCERVLVLEDGGLIADGEPAAVRSNPAVIQAYLGDPD